jgi:hypothetical protein
MIIPKTGLEGNVCGACEKAITNPQQVRPPPDALQRRLDFLANTPAPNPITVYTTSKSNKKMSNLKRGLSVEDTAIADRLERLQRDRKASMNIPTEAEMEERLSKLKDQPHIATDLPKNTDHNNLLLKTDKRSDVQKTKDLLEQANAEVDLENKMPKPEDELRDRLAKLRGQEIDTNTSKPMDICPETFLKNPSAMALGAEQTTENMTDLCKLLDEVAMEADDEASNLHKSVMFSVVCSAPNAIADGFFKNVSGHISMGLEVLVSISCPLNFANLSLSSSSGLGILFSKSTSALACSNKSLVFCTSLLLSVFKSKLLWSVFFGKSVAI